MSVKPTGRDIEEAKKALAKGTHLQDMERMALQNLLTAAEKGEEMPEHMYKIGRQALDRKAGR